MSLAPPATSGDAPKEGSPPTADAAEYNKKWQAYVLIAVTSLINFVSIASVINVGVTDRRVIKHLGANLMFGIATFVLTLLVLLFDRVSWIRERFDLKSAAGGRAEGVVLVGLVLWWIVGATVQTRAGSVAYEAINVYFSSWASLFACISALDKWGGEQNVLTLRQLTRLSATLRGWWIVFLASLVTLGSASNALHLVKNPELRKSCEFAVAVGFVSALISALIIAAHYELLRCRWLTYGGFLELVFSGVANVWYVIALDRLTGAGMIASTITGMHSNDDDYVPGSNIYVSLWTGFMASCMVTARWKEASAMKFARTNEAAEQGNDTETGMDNGSDDDKGDSDDEHDDDDDDV